MRSAKTPATTFPDELLLNAVRNGDSDAFAELWRRHAHAGLRVARGLASPTDADDLVAEAYARILQTLQAGRGPTGVFRPYLYTTIRNLARRWGRTKCEVNVDDLEALENPIAPEDPLVAALDASLTAQAFLSLPERWQRVLWYTEVEDMTPRQIAPILGTTASSVAALSHRAREGLRTAWLQAHISNQGATGECRWVISRLAQHLRCALTSRERQRVDEHLGCCAACVTVHRDLDELGSRLALTLIPLVIGGVGAGSILTSLSTPASANAAALVAPPHLAALSAASSGTTALHTAAVGLGATALAGPLVTTLAASIALSIGLAIITPTAPGPEKAAQNAFTLSTKPAAVSTLPTTSPNPRINATKIPSTSASLGDDSADMAHATSDIDSDSMGAVTQGAPVDAGSLNTTLPPSPATLPTALPALPSLPATPALPLPAVTAPALTVPSPPPSTTTPLPGP